MMNVSKQKVFIDTNILFYTNNPSDPFGKQSFLRLEELTENKNELVISTQIIKEYAAATLRNALFHKIQMSLAVPVVISNIEKFRQDFTVLFDDDDTIEQWLKLLPTITTSKDVFDFNIAATMQGSGVFYILTNNGSDFAKFNSWLTVLPLFEG